jgi:hypothetical protein
VGGPADRGKGGVWGKERRREEGLNAKEKMVNNKLRIFNEAPARMITAMIRRKME